MDTTGSGLCDTQIVHLHSSTVNRSGNTKGSQNVKRMGLEYRKEAYEEDADKDDTTNTAKFVILDKSISSKNDNRCTLTELCSIVGEHLYLRIL